MIFQLLMLVKEEKREEARLVREKERRKERRSQTCERKRKKRIMREIKEGIKKYFFVYNPAIVNYYQ